MGQDLRIRDQINCLARLDAMLGWQGDLNPPQSALREYLARANRFSQSRSQLTDCLGAARGTISQPLKSLGQNGYGPLMAANGGCRALLSEELSQTDTSQIYHEQGPT